MDLKDVIKQLEDLKEHCEDMIDKDDYENIWRKDVKALNRAIKIVKEYKFCRENKLLGGYQPTIEITTNPPNKGSSVQKGDKS
jgi:hypothetical protein